MKGKLVPLRRAGGAAAEMSDEALVAASATGEGAALGTLYDRYVDAVRGFLGRLRGTDDRDLDDLVQATFLAIPGASRSYRGDAPVKSWLLGIANNVARHHVRGEMRRKRAAAAFASEPRAAVVAGEAAALAHERGERLRAAVLALSPKLREAFVLVYFEGLSGRDVAAVLGVGEGAVWKRLHAARRQVREAMKGLWP